MKKIGIIGYGNMGSAIAERIKSAYDVVVFDKDINKTRNLSGIRIAMDIISLVKRVDVMVLAVKPQDFDTLLKEIKDYAKDKLVISIAAGITTSYIETRLQKARVVRAMPNLPAKIGKGMICLCKGKFTDGEDLNFTNKLFSLLGKTLIIEENLMNACTAISGSGPVYVCNYLEAEKEGFSNDFQKAAKSVGFNAKQSAFLVNTTFSGTVEFLKETKISPSELKRQVASKGGTTEAALEVLHNGGSLVDAVKAAVKRARELSMGA